MLVCVKNIKLNVKCNTSQHQLLNSECGVYCIYVISELLKGRTWENVCEVIIRDEKMNNFRKKYFRPSIKNKTFLDLLKREVPDFEKKKKYYYDYSTDD